MRSWEEYRAQQQDIRRGYNAVHHRGWVVEQTNKQHKRCGTKVYCGQGHGSMHGREMHRSKTNG